MSRDELVEKVFSITKVCAEPCKPDANDCPCRVDADAAIDVALEEAARVAEETVAYSTGQAVIRESIAAAIRALKRKDID